MPKYSFKPEPHVDEAVWLDVESGDPWEVWRSMPEGPGASRKKMRLVAHLIRQITDVFPEPVFLDAIEAGEKYADGLVTYEQVCEVRRLAYEFDMVELSEAAYGVASCATNYLYEVNETAEQVVWAAGTRAAHRAGSNDDREEARKAGEKAMAALCRRLINEVFGNPFRPTAFRDEWRTDTAVALARTMYDSREFSAMPILADALQDAGGDSDDVLNHCRDPKQLHVRGCWVVDLVLDKG